MLDFDEVNFGGGGGGGIILGGVIGLPLDGEINFFGAGIFDTFLTPKPTDGSTGFKNSETCSYSRGKRVSTSSILVK